MSKINGRNTSRLADNFVAGLTAMFATHYRNEHSRRIKAGLDAKRARARA